MNDEWNYHAGLGKFAQYNNFNTAMSATYGSATGLDEYLLKAQLMAYDGERAMFEAYGANKYRATGVIQWMLNNAWPSFIWHLYDYYLVPGGGYFGTKKANEPLHIQYRYDDRNIVLVNSTLRSYEGLQAEASLYSLDGTKLFNQTKKLNVAADAVVQATTIPPQNATTFLKLELRDPRGHRMSENFYWIPAKLAELDWDKSTYVNTPAIHYADMRDLSTLPQASVRASAYLSGNGSYEIHLENTKSSIAFFLQLRAVKAGTDDDIAPIYWDDNYVSLVPGEKRKLSVSGFGGAGVEFKLNGWNLASKVIEPEGQVH